jgi:hypothetical protein
LKNDYGFTKYISIKNCFEKLISYAHRNTSNPEEFASEVNYDSAFLKKKTAKWERKMPSYRITEVVSNRISVLDSAEENFVSLDTGICSCRRNFKFGYCKHAYMAKRMFGGYVVARRQEFRSLVARDNGRGRGRGRGRGSGRGRGRGGR